VTVTVWTCGPNLPTDCAAGAGGMCGGHRRRRCGAGSGGRASANLAFFALAWFMFAGWWDGESETRCAAFLYWDGGSVRRDRIAGADFLWRTVQQYDHHYAGDGESGAGDFIRE